MSVNSAAKTATIPAVRVTPRTRREVEVSLHPGESLSSFMEEALRQHVIHRRTQEDFVARGLAAAEAARRNNDYVSAEQVVNKLEARLRRMQRRRKK